MILPRTTKKKNSACQIPQLKSGGMQSGEYWDVTQAGNAVFDEV